MATTTRFSDLLLDIPYTELCFVEGGTFTMGDGSEDNNPPHQVSLSDFWIGCYPVTQVFYEAVMGNNPSHFKGKNHPVEQVSWFDAILFCNRLSVKLHKRPCYYLDNLYKNVALYIENLNPPPTIYYNNSANGYKLPTEAEWEYAAKGGKNQDKFKFAGSNTPHEVGWFDDNSHQKTQPVGLKKANSLGIYDINGNVWECCNDWYIDNYYKDSRSENPLGPSNGNDRVQRGGGYDYDAQDCHIVYRYATPPTHRDIASGFRLCCRS